MVQASIAARVSGRRLLATLVAWPLATAAVLLVTGRLAAVLQPQYLARHRADAAAIFLAEAYLVLLATLTAVFGGPAGLRSRLGLRFTSIADVALALATWLVALAAGVGITAALTPLIGAPPSNAGQILRLSFDPLFVGLVVATVCVLAPLAEELLFRGALFGWLRGFLPMPLAVLVSAAVFAGAHLIPLLFPILFVFGVATALVYQRTGSTLNSFAMHAGQNTFATVITYVAIAGGRPLG